ncbi:hypothetical protein ACFOET_11415 [Parapedobacter deserti]|uniref:Uncharacterized protein n=1 Tax=Parapedobacter deserti TaxID=1912957 RepID=A0ABV7JMV1_9SPHI
MENQILVLWATGKTGSRVAERLQKMGIRVRSGSRTANPPFDWEKPDGWSKALEGRNESVADGIKKALGREPGSFDEYVAKAKMTGVWDNKNTSV